MEITSAYKCIGGGYFGSNVSLLFFCDIKVLPSDNAEDDGADHK